MSHLTLEQLKVKNPELYAQCMIAGVEEGIQKERARCISHLPKHANDPAAKLAIHYVITGEPMTNMAKANYLCIQIEGNRKKQQQAAESEKVVSMLEFRFGIKRDENNG